MPRHPNLDLSKDWKIPIPSTIAARVELAILDPIHRKPIYGARNKLVTALLEWWVARESGKTGDDLPHIPSVAELRNLI